MGPDGHWGNAVYVAVVSSLYFFFHTFIIVPYLAALSEIVPDENSRVRVASWQTFFNTGAYVLTFVVAPLLFAKFGVRGAALMLLPGFVTFIGPLLVIKEGPTNIDSATSKVEEQVPLWDSLKMTLTNKTFLIYMSSVATFYFGLQFFLGGIAFMAADMMGISDAQLGLMNAAAFAPVPIMLILFNLLSRKKGAKYAFRVALLVFAVAMLMYPLGWQQLNLPVPPMVVGIIAGVDRQLLDRRLLHHPLCLPGAYCRGGSREDRQEPRGHVLRRAGRDQPVRRFAGRLGAGAAVGMEAGCGNHWSGGCPADGGGVLPIQALPIGTAQRT